MRHSYDQSEYTRPGEEFSLPPEQSATLSGGRRLTDRFGVRERNLAEPDEAERQAAEILAEEGPAGEAPGEELTTSAASSASADAQQTAERRARKKRSLLLQFAAAASSVVLVTNSFGIDLLGLDGLFNDSVIFGEVHSSEPDHWLEPDDEPDDEPEPDLIYGDLIPFGGDRVFPRLDNNDWTVTQDTTVDANNKYIAAVDFINGSMGEQAMVESFVWYGRKAPQFYTGPIPMSIPENIVSAESPSIYYDFDTNTLTLNNYHGKGLMINNMGQDFTIRLEGDSVLSEYLMVACGSVTITGDGGITINDGEHYDYGIHVIGQWTKAHLMLDENVKFDISGAHSIFRVTSTCSEKPVLYKTPHPMAEIYQGQLKAEDTSSVREDPETYHSWLMVGAQTHSTIVKLNNSYRPDSGTDTEPSSEAPPETEPTAELPGLPIGGDSSYPSLPNLEPGGTSPDGFRRDPQILRIDGEGMDDFESIYQPDQGVGPVNTNSLSYDPSSNTLTLNNFRGYELQLDNLGNGFKIRLVGKNILENGIHIQGNYLGASIHFTGDGYLYLNSTTNHAGLYVRGIYSPTCVMIDSTVTMDLYGDHYAFWIEDTSTPKGVYYESDDPIDGVRQVIRTTDEDSSGTVSGSYNTWISVDANGDPVKHIHIGGEVPEDPELPGLPVGGDSSFPVLPNPDPNTPVPTYGILDENYIRVFDRETNRLENIYVNRNQTQSVITEPGISYNQRTNTLTLNNYHGAGISANMMGNSFTVELIGENVLTQDLIVWGFYTAGSIRFTGNGSLSINSSLAAPVGLNLECEFSESCIMIEEGVTLDIYGATYALLVNASTADKAVYLLSSSPIPGIRQAVTQEVDPDVDFVSQRKHSVWTLLRSDTGEPAIYCHIKGSRSSR